MPHDIKCSSIVVLHQPVSEKKKLGIIGQYPSAFKSIWLHVVIFQFLYVIWGIYHKFLQNDR